MLLTAAAAAGLAVPAAQAKIRLPALVGANMVVQQRSQAPLWGWARPGSTVRVTPSWDKKAYPTQADAQGYWRVKVPTRGAGGPYSLTFSDGEKLTIGNVLVGGSVAVRGAVEHGDDYARLQLAAHPERQRPHCQLY